MTTCDDDCFYISMECQGVVSFSLNLVIFATFLRFRRVLLTTADYKLFCSMTFADMLVGFLAVLYGELLRQSQPSIIYKTLAILPLFTSMFASIASLICITINRLISIKKPLRYRAIVTSQRLVAVFILIWGVPGLIYALQLSVYLKSSATMELRVRSYMTAGFFTASSLLLIASNSLMYCAVKRQVRLIAAQTCFNDHLKILSSLAAGDSVATVAHRQESSDDTAVENFHTKNKTNIPRERTTVWKRQSNQDVLAQNNVMPGVVATDEATTVKRSSTKARRLKFSDICENGKTFAPSAEGISECRKKLENNNTPHYAGSGHMFPSNWKCSVAKTVAATCSTLDAEVGNQNHVSSSYDSSIGQNQTDGKNTTQVHASADVTAKPANRSHTRHQKMGMVRNLAVAIERVRMRRRNNPQAGRQSLDMTHMCILVVVAFVICWSPLTIYRCRYLLGMEPIVWFRRFALFLATGNSVVNPFIYLLKQRNLRKYVRRLLWRRCSREIPG